MTTRTRQRRLIRDSAAVAAGLLMLGVVAAWASGGGSYRVWFVDPHGPRGGELASWLEEPPLLEPTFEVAWLIAAWREGTGRPLDDVEREVLAELVGRRRNSPWAPADSVTGDAEPSPESRWRAVRRGLGLDRQWTATSRTVEQRLADGSVRYLFFENCLPAAFGAAADTFEDRRQRAEYDAAALRAWVAAQDQVFSNCPNIRESTIPEPAAGDSPQLVRDDRTYQVGAAQFYAGLYEDAIATWDELASGGGELAELAAYLTGRAALRWYDVGAVSVEDSVRAGEETRGRLSSFVRDGVSPVLVTSARGLLDLHSLRSERPVRLRSTALAVATSRYRANQASAGADEGDAGQRADAASVEVVRREWMTLIHLLGERQPSPTPFCYAPFARADATWDDTAESFAVWLQCVRTPSRQALYYRTESAQGPERALWATAALLGASRDGEVHDEAALRTLQQMQELVPELFGDGSSEEIPGWLRRTAALHAARIEIEHRLFDAARQRLSKVDPEGLRLDDRNRWLRERSRAASTFDDWLGDSILEPVAEGWSDASEVIWDMDEQRYPRVVRSEVVQVLGSALETEGIVALSERSDLPDWLRPSVALRAWLLAALDGDERSVALARSIAQAEPRALPNGYDAEEFRVSVLTEAALGDLRRYSELASEQRPWWVAWMLLQHDELGVFLPDVAEGIWPQPWCSAFHLEPDLSPLQRLAGAPSIGEFEGYAPYSTGTELMAWVADQVFARLQDRVRAGDAASEQPLAEALHLLVRRTRPSVCRNGPISQRAFQELHRHFPESEWARATPYWYE